MSLERTKIVAAMELAYDYHSARIVLADHLEAAELDRNLQKFDPNAVQALIDSLSSEGSRTDPVIAVLQRQIGGGGKSDDKKASAKDDKASAKDDKASAKDDKASAKDDKKDEAKASAKDDKKDDEAKASAEKDSGRKKSSGRKESGRKKSSGKKESGRKKSSGKKKK